MPRHVETIAARVRAANPDIETLPLKSGKSKFNSSFSTIRTLIRTMRPFLTRLTLLSCSPSRFFRASRR